jgi:uncharacterized protein (DUF2336 family)
MAVRPKIMADSMSSGELTEESLCVRLAAAPDTAPEVLRTLAREGPVTVRAAVAMNPSAPEDANHLLAGDGDERVRALLARKLAAMAHAPQSHKILAVLADDEAVRVRSAISDVVKQMAAAPHALILLLAQDAVVAVSDPVIRLSPVLTEADLLGLLATPASAATGVSVANRADLNEVISDAITATADSAAIRALLCNASAAIREATLDALIANAPANTGWHSPLVNRPVLPTRAARALSEIVAAQLLETLTGRTDLDPGLAADLRHRLKSAPGHPAEPPRVSPEQASERALQQAYAMNADGQLTEDAVIRAVQSGDAVLAAAMLAAAAGVTMAVIDRACSLRSAKGLVSLIWQAGFGKRVAGPLQAMLTNLAPSAILPPGPNGDFPLAVEEMRWQLDFLRQMGR